MQIEMFTPAEMGSPLGEELHNLSDRLREYSRALADAKDLTNSAQVFRFAQEIESLNLYYHGAN
jgi:hypothetical protein